MVSHDTYFSESNVFTQHNGFEIHLFVACISSLLFLFAENILFNKYTTLFFLIHLSIEGYFQFEIIKNKDAINILKQVILWKTILLLSKNKNEIKIHISLMTYDIDNFSYYFLLFIYYLVVESPSLAHFWLDCLFFWYFIVEILYVLSVNPLSETQAKDHL